MVLLNQQQVFLKTIVVQLSLMLNIPALNIPSNLNYCILALFSALVVLLQVGIMTQKYIRIIMKVWNLLLRQMQVQLIQHQVF